jgi:hypothetical protein
MQPCAVLFPNSDAAPIVGAGNGGEIKWERTERYQPSGEDTS